jgi:hypothetical protein
MTRKPSENPKDEKAARSDLRLGRCVAGLELVLFSPPYPLFFLAIFLKVTFQSPILWCGRRADAIQPRA